jgi:hypothetical protein
MNKLIKLGTVVQLWCDAANYGVITKINKITFVVEHNLHGRTRYRIDSLDSSMCVSCEENIFKGTLIPPEKMNCQLFEHLYSHAIYRGHWWNGIESELEKLYSKFMSLKKNKNIKLASKE